MRRGAEAVDPESLREVRIAGELERSKTDQSSAEQGSGMGVIVLADDPKGVPRVCRTVLGVAAIDVIAGEASEVAQIFSTGGAVRADATGPTQPGDTHPVASAKQ